MALHKNLAGNDLHEPKGINTAEAGTVYVANGDATLSGAWLPPTGRDHAIMRILSSSTNTVCSAATWVNVTAGWTSVHADGGVSFVTDSLVFDKTGDYLLMGTVSLYKTGAPANTNIQIDLAVNGFTVGYPTNAFIQNDPINTRIIPLLAYVEVNEVGSTLKMRLNCDITSNIVVSNAKLVAFNMP